MKKRKGTLTGIMHLYQPYKALLVLVLFGSILASLESIAWPILSKQIIYTVSTGGQDTIYNDLLKFAVIGIGLTFLRIFIAWIQSERASVLTDNIKFDLKTKIFNHYQNMDFTYYDNTRAGGMIAMIDYDVSKIDEFAYTLLTSIISLIITTIGALILFTNIAWQLIVCIIPLLIAFLIFNMYGSVKLKAAFSKMREEEKLLTEDMEDKVAGVKTVISFGKQQSEINHFILQAESVKKVSRKAWIQSFIRNASSHILDNAIYLVILVGGGYMLVNNVIDISDLTVFLMYSYMLIDIARSFSQIDRMYTKAASSYDHIEKFFNTQPQICDPKNEISSKIKGNVSIENVSFKYDVGNDMVIEDLSMEIQMGKFVAIVGPSGSGKSTLAGLIPRFYDVTRGTIKIDDINVKDYGLTYLRRNIGIVQQEIYLFYGTIYDNIAYAVPHASMESVIEAAKKANAHNFISELPNGYNSNIGDRGVKLSGGQKQRIAIARVFLANPPIIIFDEATSALDNESEKEVQQAMERLSEKRTTIVIAHRLSTIQNADKIYFLSKNGIEESGTHDELMQLQGKYAALYDSSK